MGNIKQRALKMYGDESRWTDILNDLPIGRLAKPEEISDVIALLASERASYISGVTITIDGGLKTADRHLVTSIRPRVTALRARSHSTCGQCRGCLNGFS